MPKIRIFILLAIMVILAVMLISHRGAAEVQAASPVGGLTFDGGRQIDIQDAQSDYAQAPDMDVRMRKSQILMSNLETLMSDPLEQEMLKSVMLRLGSVDGDDEHHHHHDDPIPTCR